MQTAIAHVTWSVAYINNECAAFALENFIIITPFQNPTAPQNLGWITNSNYEFIDVETYFADTLCLSLEPQGVKVK